MFLKSVLQTKQIDPTLNPWMYDSDTAFIVRAVNGRFVGGCVRNACLNKEPADIDIATAMSPVQVINTFRYMSAVEIIPTGILHGTVTAKINSKTFEITTLRRDVETDGRHAEVIFTDSWEDDAARRDFTFNAMSMDLNGQIYDYFDGLKDLEDGRVKFVGDPEERIKEDYLRILRFFRFHATYGNCYHWDSLVACGKLSSGLKQISGERVHAELFKTFSQPGAHDTIRQMRAEGVLDNIHIECPYMQAKNLCHLYYIWYDLLEAPIESIVVLAALIGTRSKEYCEEVAERIKLTKDDKKRLMAMMECSKPEISANFFETKQELYQWGKETWLDRFWLAYMRAPNRLTEQQVEALYNTAKNYERPNSPVTGKKLLKLGIAPGRQMGVILKLFDLWWIDTVFTKDYEACSRKLYALIVEHG